MAGLGYSDARRQAATAAASALAKGQSPSQAAQAAIAATDKFFGKVSRTLKLAPQLKAQACAPGCAWCCYQAVGITEAELALVSEAIASKPPEIRAAIASRAAEAATKGAGLDLRQWWAAHIPCPLLDGGGQCVIHAARPFPCRAQNSTDAGACQRSWNGEDVRMPALAAQHGIWAHAQAGLAEALAQSGHSAQAVNLALAVDLVLRRLQDSASAAG